MNYYLDTEFIECEKQRKVLGVKIGAAVPTIDLISLAVVAEDGRELYLLNADCELQYAWDNEWVRDNVLRAIWNEHTSPAMKYSQFGEFSLRRMKSIFSQSGKTKLALAGAILKFVQESPPEKHSFCGYYCDYDWVVFCQLFGRMIDLPHGFPMYCIDLKQELDRLGITSEQKQLLCPDPVNEHNALADARWNKQLHQALKGQAAHVD